MVGIGQTFGTCWLHSALNMFVLSDDGFKILWAKMKDEYEKMGPDVKAYFNSNINAPCLPRLGATTFKAVYFWKFLDQFMCSIGGPGQLWRRHGRNAELVSTVKWEGNINVHKGAVVTTQLLKLLDHLGFTKRDYTVLPGGENLGHKLKPPKFLLYKNLDVADLPQTLSYGYILSGGIFTSQDSNSGHAWACIIKNDKGYIFDSTYPDKLHPCDWWNEEKVKSFFESSNLITKKWNRFKISKSQDFRFAILLYAKRGYVNKIAPSCRRAYRPMTAALQAAMRNRLERNSNSGQYANNSNIPEAMKVELRKYEASRINLTANSYQAILNSATSRNNAMERVNRYEKSGYRVRRDGVLWRNFIKALHKKFEDAIYKHYYNTAIRYAATNKKSVLNNIRLYAKNNNFVINRNAPGYKKILRNLNAKFPQSRTLRSAKSPSPKRSLKRKRTPNA